MFAGPYASFIGGSYALVGLVVIALIAGTVLDYRRQKRRLRALEEAGITRRSAQSTSGAA